METLRDKQKKAFIHLREPFGYKNLFEVPKIEKVVISTGIGSLKEKDKIALVNDRLTKITGQKTAPRQAKKSVAAFKTRQGDVVGHQVTLRGNRMYEFLEKFIHAAIPRTKDFRGFSLKAIDQAGNVTFGIKEHTIFPETTDEELKNVFGLSITVVTDVKNQKEALAYLELLGFPFKKA